MRKLSEKTMNYTNIKKLFGPIFEMMATGSRVEVKEAKKEIEKLWRKEHHKFRNSGRFVLEVIDNFDSITDPVHKADIIAGLSIFYLALADDYFEELKAFIKKNLQHPDGRVREAARKTGDWLYISLSSRMDEFSYLRSKSPSQKRKETKAIAIKQYRDFVAELEVLIDLYDDGSNKAEYIDDMKPSVIKSLQMVWSRLTEVPAYRRIFEQFESVPTSILKKRQEIETEVIALLEASKSHHRLDEIKEIIFKEGGQENLPRFIAMFDTGFGKIELEQILEVITDAWNHFPHRSLGGKSPVEMSGKSK
ncbi:MAG: hypothetical protein AAB774_01970 [Patescibacteria group bacterium]